MSPSNSLRVGWLALILAGGCNMITGASDYDEVSRCTGPLCGVCPVGQSWDPEREACVEDAVWCTQRGGRWDDTQRVCLPKGTCPAGQRWYVGNESCVPACGDGASECGPSCCGFGLYCVPDAKGNPMCSVCEAADLVCGETCCEPGATCTDPGRSVCSAPYGSAGQSCAGGLACAEGSDCCESATVPGGTFLMGAPETSESAYADEFPEHEVTVSSYRMDTYEVTVGRFRAFVDTWNGERPPAGAGAHPRIGGSGWRSAWDQRLPADNAELKELLVTCGEASTWLLGADDLPINCVSWFEAFLFCAWDGGRLATEAEWEFAASGGEEREYPWGDTSPTEDHAAHDCGHGGVPEECDPQDIAPVGSKPLGTGKWGQHDLAGNLYEWVLDVFDLYTLDPCDDCANAEDVPVRGVRGGSWLNEAGYLRASFRNSGAPGYRDHDVGIRCVRGVD